MGSKRTDIKFNLVFIQLHFAHLIYSDFCIVLFLLLLACFVVDKFPCGIKWLYKINIKKDFNLSSCSSHCHRFAIKFHA